MCLLFAETIISVNQIIFLLENTCNRINDVACEMEALSIKLSRKVLNHIVRRHPEVARYTHEIIMTVQNPDLIVRGLRDEVKVLCQPTCRTEVSCGHLSRTRWGKGYYNSLLHF